jgi:RNA polymerase sigma factor (sigma-70 family)
VTLVQSSGRLTSHAITAAVAAELSPLQHLTQRDNTAFWELWTQYCTEGFERYSLYWMRGNQADAEDALSSSSIKACQHFTQTPQPIVCMKSWLARLLHNHCIDTQKALQKQVPYISDAVYRLDIAPPAKPATAVQPSAEDTLLQLELEAHIRRAFDTLPPRLREPSLLRFVHQMSHCDIAAHLHLRPDAVRKRIQQARPLLQRELSAYLAGESHVAGLKPALTADTTDLQGAETEPLLPVDAVPEFPAETPIATCTFCLRLANGVEHQLYLMLDRKPTRQQQKVNSLRRYVQRHPEGWKKHRDLADLLYAMGQWHEALATYRQVLRKQPDNLAIWLRLGHMLHMLNCDEQAIEVYAQARSQARREATQHHIEGLAAGCRRHYAPAVQALQAAAALEADNPMHQRALGLVHLQAARPVEALEAFDIVLRHHPNDLAALTYSYEALHATGRNAEAYRRTARAVAIDPNHVLALTRLAHHLSTVRRGSNAAASPPESLKLLRHALKLAPDAPEVYASLAHDHMVRGEWAQARAVLRRYTADHPQSPSGWYYSAQWHARSGYIETAATAIRQAYRLAPHDAQIVQATAAIWLDADNGPELRPLIQKIRQDFVDDWRLQTTAGYALIQTDGNAEDACATSARGPQLQPRLPQAWFRHGRVLYLAGRYEAAVAAFQHGWHWLPDQDGHRQATPAALWLGDCYHALGDDASARAWWERAYPLAVQLSSDHMALAHYWQGKASLALGHLEQAQQAFQTALHQHLFYPARGDAISWLDSLSSGWTGSHHTTQSGFGGDDGYHGKNVE